jgi:hypothetical protein
VANEVTLGNAAQGAWKRSSFQTHLFSLNNTKVMSSHVIKFGAEFRILLVNDTEAGSSTGNYTFAAALTQGPNPNAASATAGYALGTDRRLWITSNRLLKSRLQNNGSLGSNSNRRRFSERSKA